MKNRILVVDDDPEVIRLLTARLVNSGYDVSSASNGLEAMEKIKKRRPDLIVLDVMMPQMDGFNVCSCLKEDESLKDIPVLFLTGLGQIKDMKRAIEAKANAYIVKPFDSEELLETIERLIDPSKVC